MKGFLFLYIFWNNVAVIIVIRKFRIYRENKIIVFLLLGNIVVMININICNCVEYKLKGIINMVNSCKVCDCIILVFINVGIL